MVFGQLSSGPVDLGGLGPGGFRIDGPGGFYSSTVASAGDTNGDGLADVMVEVSVSEKSDAAFVLYGKRSSDPVDLAPLGTSAEGFRFPGSGFREERSGT